MNNSTARRTTRRLIVCMAATLLVGAAAWPARAQLATSAYTDSTDADSIQNGSSVITATAHAKSHSIVGVLPAEFRFPDGRTQFWVPLVPTDFSRMGGAPIGRLKDGVSIEAAHAEVGALLAQIRDARASEPGGRPPAPSGYDLVPLRDLLVEPVRPAKM